MESISFSILLNKTKSSRSRDPRDSRLASVTSALGEVLREKGTEESPANVFVEAFFTLDGTLLSEHESSNQLADCLLTQAALLKLMTITTLYVDLPILVATLPKIARLLAGLVQSTSPKGDAHNSDSMATTNDGLGSGVAVVRAVCSLVSELLRCLFQSKIDTPAEDIEILLRKTIFILLEDKVGYGRIYCEESLLELLNSESQTCVSLVSRMLDSYLLNRLSPKLLKTTSRDRYVYTMRYLQLAKVSFCGLKPTVVGERIMVLLVGVFDSLSSTEKEGLKNEKRGNRSDDILIVNSILSTLLALLEKEDSVGGAIDPFAARILATLLQLNPLLLIRNGDKDVADSSCLIYGQVLLCSIQRVLGSDYEKAVRLLPLAIDVIVKISKVHNHENFLKSAGALFAELTQIIRFELATVKAKNSTAHAACCKKCLHVMQSVLVETHQYCWHFSLTTMTALISQLNTTEDITGDCLMKLVSLRQRLEPDSEAVVVDDGVRRIVQDIGVEETWKAIDYSALSLSAPSGSFSWLLRAMSSPTEARGRAPIRLGFFCKDVLDMARHYDTHSTNTAMENSRSREYVLLLWALFPRFCNCPVDCSSHLTTIGPVLIRAMKDDRYPELMPIIANGLSILAKTRVGEKDLELDESSTFDMTELQVSSQHAHTREFAEHILPSLLKLLVETPGTPQANSSRNNLDVQKTSVARESALSDAIQSLARLISSARLQKVFARILQRLLDASQSSADKGNNICMLLSAARALVLSDNLDSNSIPILYRSLKPLARTDETTPRVQKRVYKLLAEICRNGDFLSSNNHAEDMVTFLLESSKTSHQSTRQMRLKCQLSLLESLDSRAASESFALSMLGETLLSLKDSNKRTREVAYKLLERLSEEIDDNTRLVAAITSALASESPHMRSAAVMGLSWMMHHRGKHDEKILEISVDVLKTVLLLSGDSSREVWKTVVGFIRVSIVVIPRESYKLLLPDILDCLLTYNRGRERFKGKIKIILKKLLSYFGFDDLLAVVPPADERLLHHLKKMSERQSRKSVHRDTAREDGEFEDMMASDEEDSAVTGTPSIATMTTAGKSRPRKRKNQTLQSNFAKIEDQYGSRIRIRNDTGSEEFDLDRIVKRTKEEQDAYESADDSEDSLVLDASGKLVLPVPTEESHEHLRATAAITATARRSGRGEDGTREAAGIGRRYKAKRAGGDVKRKGQKFDPYAYVPLDGRSYTRKNRRQAVEKMDSVVRRGRKRVKI